MNIQIFGKSKSFDTRKAERYFKERRIKYQYIDLDPYGISRGEFASIRRSVGNLRELIDEKAKGLEESFIPWLGSEAAIEEKLLENPSLLRTPIVRNGKQATIGYHPEIWLGWE